MASEHTYEEIVPGGATPAPPPPPPPALPAKTLSDSPVHHTDGSTDLTVKGGEGSPGQLAGTPPPALGKKPSPIASKRGLQTGVPDNTYEEIIPHSVEPPPPPDFRGEKPHRSKQSSPSTMSTPTTPTNRGPVLPVATSTGQQDTYEEMAPNRAQGTPGGTTPGGQPPVLPAPSAPVPSGPPVETITLGVPKDHLPCEGGFQLAIRPQACIVFRDDALGVRPVYTSIFISNTTTIRQAYKVKCTDNRLFRIKSPYGFIDPGQQVEIQLAFYGDVVPDDDLHFFAFYHRSSPTAESLTASLRLFHAMVHEGVKRMVVRFENSDGTPYALSSTEEPSSRKEKLHLRRWAKATKKLKELQKVLSRRGKKKKTKKKKEKKGKKFSP